MKNKEEGEIVLYQPDEVVKLEVRLENETVWLTQAQMADLFETSKQNVSLHTNNIFKEKELDANSVVKESLTTATDGKKYRTKYYNLDVIGCDRKASEYSESSGGATDFPNRRIAVNPLKSV